MIAFGFLMILLLNTCIVQGARLVPRTALTEEGKSDEFLDLDNNENQQDVFYDAYQYDTEYSNTATAFNIEYNPKIQNLRDMLKEMFDLIRSPDLDSITLIKRFLKVYQPRYKAEVRSFLILMGRYRKLQFNHPIFQRQRWIIPLLMDIVNQVESASRK